MNLNKKVSGLSVVAVLAIVFVLLKFFAFTGSDGKTPFQRIEPALQNASSSVADHMSLPSGVAGTYITSGKDGLGFAMLELDLVHVQGNQYSGQFTIYKASGVLPTVKLSSPVQVVASDGNLQMTVGNNSVMGTYGSDQVKISFSDGEPVLKKVTNDDVQKTLANLDAEAKANWEQLKSKEKSAEDDQHDTKELASLNAIVAANAPSRIADGIYVYAFGSGGKSIGYYQFDVEGTTLNFTEVDAQPDGTLKETHASMLLSYSGNHKFTMTDGKVSYHGIIRSDTSISLDTQDGAAVANTMTAKDIVLLRVQIISNAIDTGRND